MIRTALASIVLLSSLNLLPAQEIEWTKAKGLHGGNVEAIAFLSTCDYFVGTVDAGLHRTQDCGENWEDLGFNFIGSELAHINGLMVDNDGVVYMAINSRGVFRLDSSSNEWTPWNAGLPFEQYDCLAKGIDGRPTICTRGRGIYELKDGEVWTPLPDPSLQGADIRGFAVNDTMMVIGTKGGDGVYFYNFDEEKSKTIGSIGSNVVRDIHIDGDLVFVPTINEGIRMLNLRDTVWQTISDNLPTGNFQSVTTAKGRVYAGSWGNGVFSRPMDLSQGWSHDLQRETTGNVLATFNEEVFVGTNNGIYRSSDQDVFNRIGPAGGLIRSFAELDGTIYSGLLDNGIWKTSDEGLTWTEELPLAMGFFSIHPDKSNDIILAGSFDENIYSRSISGSGSWMDIGLPFKQVTDFLITKDGDVLAATHTGLSRLKVGSDQWTSSELNTSRLRAFHETGSGDIVAVSTTGLYLNSSGAESDWSEIGGLSFSADIWSVSGLGDFMLINTPPAGIYSYNVATQDSKHTILPNPDVIDVKIISESQWLAVTIEGRLLRTENGGQSWELISRAPENSRVRKMMISSKGRIILGTESNGIFVSNEIIPTSSSDLPSNLEGNHVSLYPNPSGRVANLKIVSEYQQLASLKIVDLLGRTVFSKTTELDGGTNDIRIELSDLSPGLLTLNLHFLGADTQISKPFVYQK